MKRIFFGLVTLCCMAVFCGASDAADLKIKDYVFTWIVYKAADLEMDIEKSPESVMAVLAGPGGKLGRIVITPKEARAVGEILKKTKKYYDDQISKRDMNAKDVVEVGSYKVIFSSSRGRNFGVSVASSKIFGSAANMSKEDALAVAPFLCQAPEMAALVQKRINP
ncbi:MAG: hypothetical protein JRJ85_20870 [Deltaproteobacteria bacterium]|nr:hypothetical protein [Deltaproteobacteria bacterium]